MKSVQMSTMHTSHFARFCKLKTQAGHAPTKFISKKSFGNAQGDVLDAHNPKHVGFCNPKIGAGRVPSKFTSKKSFGFVREDVSEAHTPNHVGRQRKLGNSASDPCQ